MKFNRSAQSKSGQEGNTAHEDTGPGKGTQRAQLLKHRGIAFTFGPGLFFLLLAGVTIIAPQFILAVVAGVFLFVGLLLSFLAWKFIQLRKNFEAMSEKFKGTAIQIHGLSVGGNPFEQVIVDEDDEDDEVVIIH